MADLIETAIYSQREGAGWTGLGQTIPTAIAQDPRAMAALLGATFNVVKRECFYKSASGEYVSVDGREVLVRDDTGAMLEVVSESSYHVDNRQPIDVLEAFRDELKANNMEISHGAVLDGGRRIAVCALLSADLDYNVGKGDAVKNYVTLMTGYNKKDGSKRTRGTIRVVCNTTLEFAIAQAMKDGKLQTKRASTHFTTSTLSDMVKDIASDVQADARVYNALANTAMSADAVARYFADVLEINVEDLGKFQANGKSLVSTKSRNMLAELASAYGSAPGAAMATGTAWGALNAVTYYATHVKTVRDMTNSGTEAARVSSNFGGDASKLKTRALELAARSLAVAA